MAVRRFVVRGSLRNARAWAIGLSAGLGLAGAWVISRYAAGVADVSEVASLGLIALISGVFVYRKWLSGIEAKRTQTGELSLGSDGLSWKTDEGETFVAWPDVGEVRVTWTEAIIERAGRAPLPIRTGGGKKIARLIAEGKAAFASRLPTEVPLALSDAAELRRLLEGPVARTADYRAGAEVDPDVLVRVAEDPLAPLLSRVSAVLRLPDGASAQRARVRVAVEEVLDPPTRQALTASLRGELSPEQLRALEDERTDDEAQRHAP